MSALPTTPTNMPCKVCKMTGHNVKTCPMNQEVTVTVSSSAVETKPAKKTKAPPTTRPRAVKKTKEEQAVDKLDRPDLYTADILRRRYRRFKEDHDELQNIIQETGLSIRHANPPEDITENIAKFVIQNYDNDPSCKWAKAIEIKGDLCSKKFSIEFPPEVKAFTSDGPSSFGPKKKFGAIYFVNMVDLIQHDKLIVWKVNLTNESPEWKNVKMSKTQIFNEQCEEGRRPHISWSLLYPQIKEHCLKIYEGSFEGIFTPKIDAGTLDTVAGAVAVVTVVTAVEADS